MTLLLSLSTSAIPKEAAKNPHAVPLSIGRRSWTCPSKGVFYTSTYRDSVIGQVDKEGGLVRTKEDANRISFKKGGEKVQDKGDSLQYAGVVNADSSPPSSSWTTSNPLWPTAAST